MDTIPQTIGPRAPPTQGGNPETRVSDLERMRVALDAAGELSLPIDGRSMGVAWTRAEAVVVRAVPQRCPGWGSIVVGLRRDRWVAHRLLLGWGDRLVTKGDARWTWDAPPLRVEDIRGVVVALVRDGRREGVPPRAPVRAMWELAKAVVAWPVLAVAPRRATRAPGGA